MCLVIAVSITYITYIWVYTQDFSKVLSLIPVDFT